MTLDDIASETPLKKKTYDSYRIGFKCVLVFFSVTWHLLNSPIPDAQVAFPMPHRLSTMRLSTVDPEQFGISLDSMYSRRTDKYILVMEAK